LLGIQKNFREHRVSETGYVRRQTKGRGETPALLGLLERAHFDHWTTPVSISTDV
jgi:hypothetical protein